MERLTFEGNFCDIVQCENAKTIIELAFADGTSKVERIRELTMADKEGRVVVLPGGKK